MKNRIKESNYTKSKRTTSNLKKRKATPKTVYKSSQEQKNNSYLYNNDIYSKPNIDNLDISKLKQNLSQHYLDINNNLSAKIKERPTITRKQPNERKVVLRCIDEDLLI